MIRVAYQCPSCSQGAHADVAPRADSITCSQCGRSIAIPSGALHDGELSRCLVCPSTELFVRKDFPQRLGVSIVVAGFAVSCVTWYFYLPYWTFAALFATALVDVVLWFVVPNCLNCYRCDAQYRGLQGLEKHGNFDLETHERYRQQAIRLRQTEAAAERHPVRAGSSPDA